MRCGGLGSVAVGPAVDPIPPLAIKGNGSLLVGLLCSLHRCGLAPRSKAANDGEFVSIHWSK